MTGPQRGLQRTAAVLLGLTASVVAVVTRRVDGTTLVNSETFTSRGRRGASVVEHRARIAEQAGTVDHAVGTVVLVVIEGLAAAATSDDRALRRAVLGRLRARAVPLAVARPGTGGERVERARCLACMSAVRLGWDVQAGRCDPDALAGVQWPAGLTADRTTEGCP